MKVGIIGKGLAGIITALSWKTISPGVEVEIYYDNNIPPVPVGAGSNPNFLELLTAVNRIDPQVQVDWRNNCFDATPKTGILYEGWGTTGVPWFHPFASASELAMHFDPIKMQDYFLNCGFFKVIEKNIESYDDLDVDYVYDCAGFPKDYDDYFTIRNPLNKVLLANLSPSNNRSYGSLTRTVATPDGWCFHIPLTTRTSLGYLYNDTITTDEEAEKNFREQFGVEEIEKTLSFKNYCAKNPIIDGRVFLNGNKYFFIEPMEAISVGQYYRWAGNTITHLLNPNPYCTLDDLILADRQDIYESANFILYHYSYGSKYDTPFWDYAKSLKADDFRMDAMITKSYDSNWFGISDIPYGGFHLNDVLQCHYELVGDNYYERRKEHIPRM